MSATSADAVSSESDEPGGQVPPPSSAFGEDTEFIMAAGLTAMDFVWALVPPKLLFLIATNVLGYALSWPLVGAMFGGMLGLAALAQDVRDVRRVTFEEYDDALRSPNSQPGTTTTENAENSAHSTQNHDITIEEN